MDVMDTCIDVDNLEYLANQDLEAWRLPIGSKVVPLYGSYLESYKVIPKRNY